MEVEQVNGPAKKKAESKLTIVKRKTPFDWEGLKAKVEADHWRKLAITIQLRDKLHAGKPAQLDAAKAMLKARGLEEVVEASEAERPIDERAVEVVDEGLCEFHRREGRPGIWWPSNNMKACIKENWSVLGYRVDANPVSKRGVTDPLPEGVEFTSVSGKKSKTTKYSPLRGSRGGIAEGLFVCSAEAADRDWIYLGEKPEGVDQSVSHHTGPKGPQSSIKRNEYVLRTKISFEVWIARAVEDKIPDESFADMLLHAQEHGIGANRSQGIGRFDVLSVVEV